jgi:hypothetical protein
MFGTGLLTLRFLLSAPQMVIGIWMITQSFELSCLFPQFFELLGLCSFDEP